MASMREIKRRKSSIQSTGQITKAMKLVSTVKLQKAKVKAEESKPYFNQLYRVVSSMLSRSDPEVRAKYLSNNPGGKKAVIVISSNRGLAGGYNGNIVKLVTGSDIAKEDAWIYAIGRKGAEVLSRKGYEIKEDRSEIINAPLYSDASELASALMEEYEKGNISEIYIAYTVFKNTVSHIPTLLKLLPTDDFAGQDDEESLTLMNFEPEPEEALEMIMPKYLGGEIYGALIEAVASENGARMQAMDSATSNAEDMISSLELQYNRARQGSITQELTEIIAGANAINQ
ncbi:MAG: ATP synthase F1 subunit gamma [Lachnospiraceae bacterium]